MLFASVSVHCTAPPLSRTALGTTSQASPTACLQESGPAVVSDEVSSDLPIALAIASCTLANCTGSDDCLSGRVLCKKRTRSRPRSGPLASRKKLAISSRGGAEHVRVVISPSACESPREAKPTSSPVSESRRDYAQLSARTFASSCSKRRSCARLVAHLCGGSS